MKKRAPTREGRAEAWQLFGHLVVHLSGVVVVAMLSLWVVVGKGHLEWLLQIHQIWGDPSLFMTELLVHLGVSVVLWTTLFLIGKTVLSGERKTVRVVRRARGTVITETIIIMPVLLLIILGLSQLVVLNIAGMLMNYGSSQAARTVWLWAPELSPLNDQPARRGVTEEMVADMARIQVALALTPVAPSDFRGNTSGMESVNFEQMRGAILGAQILYPPNDAGRLTIDGARGAYQFTGADERAFWRALDGSNFSDRSVRKFTFAYLALEVEAIIGPEEVGAAVTYQQKIMFPFVNTVFGKPGSVAGLGGVYTQYDRRFVQVAQVAPNAELPRR